MVYLLVSVLCGVIVLALYFLFSNALRQSFTARRTRRKAVRQALDKAKRNRNTSQLDAAPSRDFAVTPPRSQEKRGKGSLLGVCGLLLIVAGILVTGHMMKMDVSSGSDVVNLDLLNQRLCGALVGCALFVGGCVLSGLNSIHLLISNISKDFIHRV